MWRDYVSSEIFAFDKASTKHAAAKMVIMPFWQGHGTEISRVVAVLVGDGLYVPIQKFDDHSINL